MTELSMLGKPPLDWSLEEKENEIKLTGSSSLPGVYYFDLGLDLFVIVGMLAATIAILIFADVVFYWIALLSLGILGMKASGAMKSFDKSKTTYQILIDDTDIKITETSRLGKEKGYNFPKENYNKFYLIPHSVTTTIDVTHYIAGAGAIKGVNTPEMTLSTSNSLEKLIYINGEEQITLLEGISNESRRYIYNMIRHYVVRNN